MTCESCVPQLGTWMTNAPGLVNQIERASSKHYFRDHTEYQLSLISEPDAAGSCFGSQGWALIFSSSSPADSRSPSSDQYERACMTMITACVALLTHASGCKN